MQQQQRPKTHVEEKQENLANMVRMIAQSQYHSLLVVSEGGTGKSRTITNILQEEEQEMEIYNSHCTTLQLYRVLYQYSQDSQKILVFDDCDELYKSGPALGILRSALFGQPNRLVTYNSSTLPSDLPARFETKSRFIFCANQVPKKCPIFDAVASRCLVCRMNLSNSEIIEQFRVMSVNGFPGCPPETTEEIVDFIELHSEEKQLSMRLFTPAIRIYKFCESNGTDWRPVLLSQIQSLGRPVSVTKRLNNHERHAKLLREAQRKFPDSVSDQKQWLHPPRPPTSQQQTPDFATSPEPPAPNPPQWCLWKICGCEWWIGTGRAAYKKPDRVKQK